MRPKAVVSFFGPGDMAYLYNHPANAQVPFLMRALIGGTPEENPESYAQSSPIHFITSQTCPTLLLQGGKDHLVTPRQASLLKDKLQNAGVTTKLIVYPHEGHGWRGESLGDSFKNISDFLDHHVK